MKFLLYWKIINYKPKILMEMDIHLFVSQK